MKKNILFVGISVVLLILLGIGLSYSMWNMSTSQETSNVIASSECFDISITSQENSISLQNAYPISNEKGKKLTPFTFTVTNVCETASKYSINLESLKGSTLSSEFLDVMLNNGEIKRLNTYSSANKVNSSSIESRELETGILGNKESKDYSLRLWIDYDTTMEDLNNETKVLKSKVIVIGTPIDYIGQTVFNFDYTGSEQTFTAPVSGTYKLETWGAQGGDTSENLHGGYGGYSGGLVELSENTKIYTNVGGAGEFMKKGLYAGGYNGGGGRLYGGAEAYAGSGGGATHMALITGLLSSLESVKDSILIVSGGGGGAKIYGSSSNDDYSGIGGSGGGFVGENGIPVNNTVYGYGKGGTQNAGGGAEIIMNKNGLTYGSFGKGAVVNEPYGNIYLVGAGGGGGYYGGGSIEHGPAAGGSGYIGNPILKDKVMYCYNCQESSEESTKTISTTCSEETPTSYCAKKGNGYARITLVSIEK